MMKGDIRTEIAEYLKKKYSLLESEIYSIWCDIRYDMRNINTVSDYNIDKEHGYLYVGNEIIDILPKDIRNSKEKLNLLDDNYYEKLPKLNTDNSFFIKQLVEARIQLKEIDVKLCEIDDFFYQQLKAANDKLREKDVELLNLKTNNLSLDKQLVEAKIELREKEVELCKKDDFFYQQLKAANDKLKEKDDKLLDLTTDNLSLVEQLESLVKQLEEDKDQLNKKNDELLDLTTDNLSLDKQLKEAKVQLSKKDVK